MKPKLIISYDPTMQDLKLLTTMSAFTQLLSYKSYIVILTNVIPKTFKYLACLNQVIRIIEFKHVYHLSHSGNENGSDITHKLLLQREIVVSDDAVRIVKELLT